jgi:hypothetical protein
VRTRRLAATAVAFALLAQGCGTHTGIDRQASDELTTAVAQVRAAARAHDVAGAQAGLDDVRRMVASLRDHRDLSDATAGRILVATDEVAADLRLIPTTTTSTSSTTTTTRPAPPPPPKKGHHGQGNGDQGGDSGD